ncbi:extracellular solute-binding protein [Paenibacillus sp. P26]|nr:extracellular solute-binding protein [Paenibacillus sp. P26]
MGTRRHGGRTCDGRSAERLQRRQRRGGKTDPKTPSQAPANLNPTGLPIVKDKVTLKIAGFYGLAGQKPFGEPPFFKSVEEKTNVHVDWQMNDANGFKEKKNLMFASGDLPDAFYGHYILETDEVVKYGYQGLFIPLEGLIDKYAPNFKKILDENPDYKKDLTAPDGHIYSPPTVDDTYPKSKDALFINKKWLDKLGMPPPTTPDEFYKTLKAFKDNDMNGNGKKDEVPFSFRVHAITGIYSMYGSFGPLDKQDHIIMKGDQVVYTAVQPEYKEATKYFNKLFAEGLVDQESLTHDEKVYGSKLRSKDRNVGAFVAWTASTYMDPEQAADYVPAAAAEGAGRLAGLEPLPFGHSEQGRLRDYFRQQKSGNHDALDRLHVRYQGQPGGGERDDRHRHEGQRRRYAQLYRSAERRQCQRVPAHHFSRVDFRLREDEADAGRHRQAQ